MTSAKAYGIDSRLLTPAEIKEMVPFINDEIIVGGFYTPSVSVVDSLQMGMLMREEAADAGAVGVVANTEVVDTGGDDEVGDVRLWVGEGIPLADAAIIADGPFIIDVDLSTILNLRDLLGPRTPVDFDWRLNEVQDVELRIETDGGNIIAVTRSDVLIAARAANGDFVCDLDSCTRDDGFDVPYPSLP